MARQENACWRCDKNWATEDDPTTTLRLVSGGAPADASSASHARIARTPSSGERAATQARLDANRWIDEGGSLGSEAIPSRATTRELSSSRA
jgi:hypothetical protein